MLPKFLFIPSLKKDFIFIVIFFYQCIDIPSGNLSHCFCDLIHRISIYFPAELDLGFYFIALCNCHVPHIIGYAHNTYMAALDHAHTRAHP